MLLTNQAEDLTKSFELASKGKMTGRRKSTSRKSTVIEGSSRMSLQSHSHHVSSHKCSAESSRPLLSSGSDGSTCDTCSEILNLACEGRDEEGHVTPCHIHYKWPSSVSHADTVHRGGSKSEQEGGGGGGGSDCISSAASDFQGTLLRRSMFSPGPGSLHCHSTSQINWFNPSHCQNCGRHYGVARSNATMSYKGRSRSPSPDIQMDSSGFTPQWTMDFHDVGIHSRTMATQKPKRTTTDRDSLCSQSSHSSGSDVSSSSSEYSVPRSMLESVYDHPRNLHAAVVCRSVIGPPRVIDRLRAPISKEKTILEHQAQVNEVCGVCVTQGPVKSAVPNAGVPLPGVHRVPYCSCWNRTFPFNRRSSISENEPTKDGLKTSPKKASTPVSSQQSCPCDGGQNPNAHYAVPRIALANIIQKQNQVEVNKANQDRVQSKAKPNTPNPAEEYDVPRKFKEHISLLDTKPLPSISHLRTAPCFCKQPFASHPGVMLGNDPRCPQDSLQTCGCHKVMLWAGSLVPCWGPGTDDTVTHASNSSPVDKDASRPPIVAVCTEPPKQATTAVDNPPRTPCNCAASGASMGASSSVTPHYVNFEVINTPGGGQSFRATLNPADPNYANLEFLQTLPLYQNTESLLSKMDSKTSGPEIIDKEAAKPPLPPRGFSQNGGVIALENALQASTTATLSRTPTQTAKIASSYEVMSFKQNPEPTTAPNQTDDNYLVMQPLCSRILEPAETGFDRGETKDDEDEDIHSIALPLRPFLPFTLNNVCEAQNILSTDKRTGSLNSVVRSPNLGRSSAAEEAYQRSFRSNSLEGLKRKVLMKKRSCSADSRQNNSNNANDGSEPEDNGPTECDSPKSAPKRKNSLFSKLSLRTKEKSYSTDEISPPSSVPSSPSNAKSFENLHRLPFHHSADCLKPNEEYHLSDEDIPSNVFSESLHSDFKYNLKIKRSSSVPCKTKDIKLPVMAGDSAVCLVSDCAFTMGKVNLTDKQYLISEHYGDHLPKAREGENLNHSSPLKESRLKVALDHGPNIKSISKQQPDAGGGDKEKMVICESRNPGSTSSSDMSDYIETLSLCSRTSSSSGGSSSDYIRAEELATLTGNAVVGGGGVNANSLCVNTMRPRFGKEYQSIDRSLLRDKKIHPASTMLGEDTEHLTEDPLSRDLRNNLNTFVTSKPFPTKSGSPSPGYISSSPGTVDCNCSPNSYGNALFQFPKDNNKELNYLEMEITDSEPASPSPAVKNEGVQYAVIDVIATEAAKKLGSERALGRSDAIDAAAAAIANKAEQRKES